MYGSKSMIQNTAPFLYYLADTFSRQGQFAFRIRHFANIRDVVTGSVSLQLERGTRLHTIDTTSNVATTCWGCLGPAMAGLFFHAER